jgi:hypothetical protein
LVRNAKSQHNNSRGRRNENIAVEVPKIKEVKGETHKTVKIDGFERSPPLNANVLFGRFSLSLTLFMTKLKPYCWLFLTLQIPPLCINIWDSKGQDNLVGEEGGSSQPRIIESRRSCGQTPIILYK